MKKIVMMFLFGTSLMFSCSKTDTAVTPTVDPNAILATEVKITTNVPAGTMADSKIHIVGSWVIGKDWKVDVYNYPLTRNADGTWSAKIALKEFPTGGISFKFVKGNAWEFVEKDIDKDGKCAELPDRKLDAATQGGKEVKFDVKKWRDQDKSCG
jgi:hypothetical protein